jgi:hypothetical protein
MRTSFTSAFAGLAALAGTVIGNPVPLPHAELDTRQSAAYEGYMMVYFTGNTIEGEKIYLAASNGNNALDWSELNAGQPALASTMGTKGLRDPFILRSQGMRQPDQFV